MTRYQTDIGGKAPLRRSAARYFKNGAKFFKTSSKARKSGFEEFSHSDFSGKIASISSPKSALGERIAGLTAIRDQARVDAARIETMLASSAHQCLTGAAVRELATEARSRLWFGKGGYRREHIRAFGSARAQ